MAEELSLRVLLADAEVGQLGVDAQQHLHFDYTDDWRQAGYALAPSVPLVRATGREEEWRAAAAAYFQNLLPEGQALEDICRSLRVSRSSTFGLLRAMGREAAGAVRILDASPVTATERLRPVSRAELSMRIRERQDVPFSVWDGAVRLSIAGYQDKLAVFEADGEWSLADGPHRASTHILKPDPLAPRLAGLTSNEFFCMRLAAAVGLPVAPVRLERVPEPVLVVERFDRTTEHDRVRRHHVIDACQALGVPPSLKYERPYGDGRDVAAVRTGVSSPALFGLGRWAAVPAAFKLHLLRWVIFQTLIQNFDAHAKNISFFWDHRGLRVAPAYDLVSIGIYPEDWFPHTFAAAIGDAFTVRDLVAYEWAHLATQCGFRTRQLANELVKLSTAIERETPAVSRQVIAEGAEPHIVERVSGLVGSTSKRQREEAAVIPKIDPTLFIAPG
jgi:serine/threonine-protein kinase HipA